MSEKKTIALICESNDRMQYTVALSARLNIPIINDPNVDYLLVVTNDHLELRSVQYKQSPIYVDFLSPELLRRCLKGGPKEMIARAVGIKGGNKPSILDATAGLGKDAFVLSSLGCKVHCLERSPIVAALLEDGLRRFQEKSNHPALSMSLTQIDAIDYMKSQTAQLQYDVIYLDPMFPEKKKNALPKKGMRVFRELLGHDLDTQTLFQLALTHAKRRIVVKRPRLAEAINEQKPDVVYEGKSSRFDVYFPLQAGVEKL